MDDIKTPAQKKNQNQRLTMFKGKQLGKENLNSDDQQFHKYDYSEQSLLTLTEHNNGPRYMTLEIQVLVWNIHTNVVGLNWFHV